MLSPASAQGFSLHLVFGCGVFLWVLEAHTSSKEAVAMLVELLLPWLVLHAMREAWADHVITSCLW